MTYFTSSSVSRPAILAVAAGLSYATPAYPEATQRIARPAFQRLYNSATVAIQPLDVSRPAGNWVDAPYIDSWFAIRALAALEPGWKGPGSVPVPQAAIDDAEQFTLATIATDIRNPDHIGAASDGELVITWRKLNEIIDVSFHGEGTYSYYAKIGENEFFGDDIPAAKSLPAELLAMIRQV